MPVETIEHLLRRNRELQAALDEAEETLRAIRSGEVDAVVATGPEGEVVYTLKGADEGYRLLVEQMSEGALTLTADGVILFANQQFAGILGLPLERVIGARVQEFVPPEARPVIEAVLAGRGRGKCELHLKRDGELVPVYVSAGSLRFEGLECATLTVTDLTEQKRNEAMVADGKLARSILEQAATAIVVSSADGKIVQANRAAERLAGTPVLLRPFSSVLQLRSCSPPKDLTFEEILSMTARQGHITGLQAMVCAADGNSVPVILNAGLLTGADSQTVGCIVTFADISELRHAEEALLASEARERARAADLNAILETAPVAIFVSHDPECREMTGNRMAYQMLRLAPGANLSSLPPEGQARPKFRVTKDGREIPPHDLPLRRAAVTGQPVRDFEFDAVLEDGTCRSVVGNAVPLVGEDGRPCGALGAFLDITERKRAEEGLRHTQKLESIGLLAGGIAHDFNNLLTGILGNASLVMDEVEAGAAERIREIIASAERAANLTRQLLAYSGKGKFFVRELDVAEAVHEVRGLVQFSIPQNVQLAVTAEARLPVVRMDPSQLQQILMNLVINAGEAIGQENTGRIGVTATTIDVEQPFVDALKQEIATGRYVCVEVSDTGSGIDEAHRSCIFDPFFTTKFTGRGLGLAAVAGIVRSQKGALTLESVPGQGSRFRVLLPVAHSSEESRGKQPVADRRGTILVVDDEAAVRNFIAAVLQRQKYRVLAASGGREALTLCQRESGPVDVAIIDVLMPSMGADRLVPALRSQRPETKILLTSGCGESEARRLSGADPGAPFIQKPYTAQQLATAVNALFGVVQ